MRYVELALMAMPAVLVLAWFLGARRASPASLALLAIVLADLGGALVWMGERRSVAGRYVPAHLEDGRVVGGAGR